MIILKGHGMPQRGNLLGGHGLTGSPAISIITNTPPSYDLAKLIVNKQIGLAEVAGNYSSVGGPVTEGTWTHKVNGVSQPRTYVLQFGDVVALGTVPLLISAVASGQYASTGNTTVPDFVLVETVASTLNAASMKVGTAFTAVYSAGTRTSPSGAITEDTANIGFIDINSAVWDINHVVQPDELQYSVNIPLLLDGTIPIPSMYNAAISTTLVTNTAPTLTGFAMNVTVQAGTAPSATVPDEMSAPTLASTATRITVTLAADPADGGSAITSYDLRWSDNAGSSWTTVTGISTGHVITGFVPGATGMLVQTRAVNSIGAAATWSTSGSVDMKNITFVGYVKGGNSGVASYNLSFATLLTDTGGIGGSILPGDLILCPSGWASSGADDDPGVVTAGYTEDLDLFQTDTRSVNFSLAHKVMGGSPDTDIDIAASTTAGSGGAGVALVYRYVDPVTPLDVTPTYALAPDGALADSPSITPVSPGAMLITIAAATGDTTPALLAPPAGVTLSSQVSFGGGARGMRIGTARTLWTGGAWDPGAWSSAETATSDSNAGISVALRPY